ncbi:hypothetical protein [Lysobacter sp. Hz 25]|uniref:hypothetical protein n=1 Tax=Lysobacter sp. Hz 25 TaxID=3383698 RepID=UPI0038D3FC0C
MKKPRLNLSETERLLRPASLAVLSALVLHMMSMSGRCFEWAIEIDMPVISAAFSAGVGIMLIVVAVACIWLLRLSGFSGEQSPSAGAGRKYDRRNTQLAIFAASICSLAAGVTFLSIPYGSLGPTGNGAIVVTQFALVMVGLFSAIKSLQFGAASIATATALKTLSSRSF